MGSPPGVASGACCVASSVRLDLHNHTHFSRDGSLSPLALLEQARDRGISCLAVTDHDALEGAEACVALAASDPTLPRVIPGVEVRTRVGEVIGLFVQRPVAPGASLVETAAAIRAQGGLVYLPHPCDPLRRAVIRPDAREEAARLADIVEVSNGRSLRRAYDREALLLAGRHGKALGAGSDAHFPGEVGRRHMEVSRVPTRDDLVELLRLGRPAPEARLTDYVASWLYVARSTVAKMVRGRRE